MRIPVAILSAASAAIAVMFVIRTLNRQRGESPEPARPLTNVLATRWETFRTTNRHTRKIAHQTWVLAAAGLVAGLIAWPVTGLISMLIIMPIAFAAVPTLISSPNTAGTEKLRAMSIWTMSLSTTLSAGSSLEGALQSSARSAPEAIRPEIETLAARIRAQIPLHTALEAFADDLDDSTGDLIAQSLILAAKLRGDGLADVLAGLAATVAEDVRNRRAIDAERAKPRSTARWITLVTMSMLGVAALFGSFTKAYSTPGGQLLLLAYLAAYGGCLFWMRNSIATPKYQRIMRGKASV